MAQLVGGLLVAKVLRGWFLMIAFDLLSGKDTSVILYTYYIVLISSFFLAPLQPWQYSTALKPKHVIEFVYLEWLA